jgi:hypothetical protein
VVGRDGQASRSACCDADAFERRDRWESADISGISVYLAQGRVALAIDVIHLERLDIHDRLPFITDSDRPVCIIASGGIGVKEGIEVILPEGPTGAACHAKALEEVGHHG